MAPELDERRKYTTERTEILETVDEVGVVEAARRHSVPQTTVSNWPHRDAAKVVQETAARKTAGRATGSKEMRRRRATTTPTTRATSTR